MQRQEERFWILTAKYYGEEIDSSEEAELFAIIEADPVKRKEFEEARLDWVGYEAPVERGNEVLWNTLSRRIQDAGMTADTVDVPVTYMRKSRFIYRWTAVAAVIILAAVSTWLLTGRSSATAGPVWTVYAAARGEMQQQRLPDGTTVYLNAGSSLRYSSLFNDSNREVFVEGEAYFDVKKDPLRPFIAHGGKLSVRVLGTAFDIKAFDADVNASVTVASGKVSVKDGEKDLAVLLPDQSLIIDQQSRQGSQLTVDHHDMEWFNDRLAFVNLSFGDIARLLERKFNVSIAFTHEDMKSCRYTAYFDHLSLQQILNQLSWTSQFTYKIEGNSILIDGKGCN